MSARRGYGQRLIRVSPKLLEEILIRSKKRDVGFDLPDDARMLSMWRSDAGSEYLITFESKEWDELMEGQEIPLLEPHEVEPQ